MRKKIINVPKYSKRIIVGGKIIKVSHLDTEDKQSLGYQHCVKLPKQNKQGLLFDFLSSQNDEKERMRSFHMKNVYFDLDVLCFDKHGILVDVIRGMESPYDLSEQDNEIKINKALYHTVYSTRKPCSFCVEVISRYEGILIPGITKLRFI